MRRFKFWLSLDKAEPNEKTYFRDSPFRLTSEMFQDWIENDSKITSSKNRYQRKNVKGNYALSVCAISERWNRQIFIFNIRRRSYTVYEFAHSTDASSSTKMQKSYLADNTEWRQAVSTSRYICGARASYLMSLFSFH